MLKAKSFPFIKKGTVKIFYKYILEKILFLFSHYLNDEILVIQKSILLLEEITFIVSHVNTFLDLAQSCLGKGLNFAVFLSRNMSILMRH